MSRRQCVFDIGEGDCLHVRWSRSGKSIGLALRRTEPFRYAQVCFRLDQIPQFTDRILESRPVRKSAKDGPSRIVEFVDEQGRPAALRTEWHRQAERVTFTLARGPYSPLGDRLECELTAEQVETLMAFLRSGP